MFLTRSIKQKIAATIGAMIGFVLFYEVNMLDSQNNAPAAVEQRDGATASPTSAQSAAGLQVTKSVQGLPMRFSATAYCKGHTTASGTAVRTGIAAADPDLLPVGSVIQIHSLGARYNGIYTVMDTGPKVQGRHIDVYMWSCHEALDFGRRPVQISVLRHGWNPRASTPGTIRSAIDSLQSRSNAEAAAAPGAAATATATATVVSDAPPAASAPAAASPPPAATPAPARSAAPKPSSTAPASSGSGTSGATSSADAARGVSQEQVQ